MNMICVSAAHCPPQDKPRVASHQSHEFRRNDVRGSHGGGAKSAYINYSCDFELHSTNLGLNGSDTSNERGVTTDPASPDRVHQAPGETRMQATLSVMCYLSHASGCLCLVWITPVLMCFVEQDRGCHEGGVCAHLGLSDGVHVPRDPGSDSGGWGWPVSGSAAPAGPLHSHTDGGREQQQRCLLTFT